MGAIEPIHILIVLFVVLLLFGAKSIPELGRSLGSGIRELKKSTQEFHRPVEAGVEAGPRAQAALMAPSTAPGPDVRGASAGDVSASRQDA